jgi:hypothetical protein
MADQLERWRGTMSTSPSSTTLVFKCTSAVWRGVSAKTVIVQHFLRVLREN